MATKKIESAGLMGAGTALVTMGLSLLEKDALTGGVVTGVGVLMLVGREYVKPHGND